MEYKTKYEVGQVVFNPEGSKVRIHEIRLTVGGTYYMTYYPDKKESPLEMIWEDELFPTETAFLNTRIRECQEKLKQIEREEGERNEII